MIAESLINKCKSTKLTFEYISPEMANRLLEINDANYRKMIKACAERYTSDIEKNRWTITTATIAISASNKLIDGQHRLNGVVESNVGIWTYVLRNCPDELLDDPNQDKGKNRTVTTYMQREGIKNSAMAAGAVRCLYRLAIGHSASRSGGVTTLTDATVLHVILNMPVLFFDCVNRIGGNTTAKKLFAPSVVSSFFYLASCRNQEAANYFLSVLCREEEESSMHPANVIREYITANRKTISNDDFLAIAFNAFDLSCKGETRKIIRSCHGYTMHNQYKEALNSLLDIADAASV
jgi:hypothetical protein